jgi:hypothetical protein
MKEVFVVTSHKLHAGPKGIPYYERSLITAYKINTTPIIAVY